MNYELAKQLKDAGYEQNPGDYDRTVEGIYYPTLSELIEACGEQFFELIKSIRTGNKKWWAYEKDTDEYLSIEMKIGYGPTPEEAVANLWLELNKK